jgi:peptidoglycan/xylan/chitin deacetylase (PgdA/CDA1 family)
MRARMTLLLLAVLTASAAAETPPACWAPGDLAHRNGEEHVQKGVKQARIPPPVRGLADYSPLPQRGAVRRVKLPAGHKLIALTFDLCEQPSEIAGYQGGIVDLLRQNQIKATFFMGGKWMLSHRERTQQLMTDPLFEVANHSWEHRNLRQLTGRALVDEIRNAQLAYEQVRDELGAKQCVRATPPRSASSPAPTAEQAPKRLGLMRFPYGACSPAALSEVAQQGLLPIQWDISSGDPTFGVSARMIEQQVLANVQPGSIVLFHANGRGWHTEGALPGIIAALKAQGYSFVTVSELMAAGEPVMTATCYDSHPGDTDHWPLRRPTPQAGAASFFGSLWQPAPRAPTWHAR